MTRSHFVTAFNWSLVSSSPVPRLRLKAAKRYSHITICSSVDASERMKMRSSRFPILIGLPELFLSRNVGDVSSHHKNGTTRIICDPSGHASEHQYGNRRNLSPIPQYYEICTFAFREISYGKLVSLFVFETYSCII